MIKVLILALSVFPFAACTTKSDSTAKFTDVQATGKKKILHIYCWSNYFSQKFITDFEEKTGAKIDLNYFSSNEELLAKLQAGARGYDLIVPSGYIIKPLKELGLLEPLGKLDWPEFSKLTKHAKKSKHDPNHEVAIPYQMGITGMAINKAKIKDKVDSLAWLFDRPFDRPKLKGQIVMLDDAPTVIGTALKYLGYSYNDSTDAALIKAKELLTRQKPLLKAYTSDTIPIMDAGEFSVTQAYSGDVLQVKRRNPNIEFILPKEGGEYYLDYLAIPIGAPHIDLAKEFMRASLDPVNAAMQTMHLFYTPVVDIKGIPGTDILLKNPILYPSENTLKAFEALDGDQEHLEKLQRLWTELKSS